MAKERSIIFCADDVRAIRERRKTQFVELLKPQPPDWVTGAEIVGAFGRFEGNHPKGKCGGERCACVGVENGGPAMWTVKCRHGATGDRLWVKETWQVRDDKSYYTKADCKLHRTEHPQCAQIWTNAQPPEAFPDWLSPVLMPRWASRITLEVESVRLCRLREITEADAIAEGIRALPGGGYGINEPFSAENTALEALAALWDSRNGKRAPWASNPWVWVVDFCLLADEQEAA